MNDIINKIVCIDAHHNFDDYNWIFMKDQEYISIDDYSNYLIIVVTYRRSICSEEIVKENLKTKFNNYEEMYHTNNVPPFSERRNLYLLNKNAHYKYLPYGNIIPNEQSTNEQYVVSDVFGNIERTIDQTNYNITRIPKENSMPENFAIIEKRFIRIKKAVKL